MSLLYDVDRVRVYVLSLHLDSDALSNVRGEINVDSAGFGRLLPPRRIEVCVVVLNVVLKSFEEMGLKLEFSRHRYCLRTKVKEPSPHYEEIVTGQSSVIPV